MEFDKDGLLLIWTNALKKTLDGIIKIVRGCDEVGLAARYEDDDDDESLFIRDEACRNVVNEDCRQWRLLVVAVGGQKPPICSPLLLIIISVCV